MKDVIQNVWRLQNRIFIPTANNTARNEACLCVVHALSMRCNDNFQPTIEKSGLIHTVLTEKTN